MLRLYCIQRIFVVSIVTGIHYASGWTIVKRRVGAGRYRGYRRPPARRRSAGAYALGDQPGGGAAKRRDSPVDRQIDVSLAVQGFDGRVDFAIKRFGIGECLMGQMVRLEIAPDNLDVIEFRCVFGQPLDGEPVLARIERRQGDFADMDRPIILDQHDGYCQAPGLGAKEAIELL